MFDNYCEDGLTLIQNHPKYNFFDICHCFLNNVSVEENVIYPIGGSGKYREDYFIKINNEFYLISDANIRKRKNDTSISLSKLKVLYDENAPVLTRPNLLVWKKENGFSIQGPADYMSLYPGTSAEQYDTIKLCSLYEDFWSQVEEIYDENRVTENKE